MATARVPAGAADIIPALPRSLRATGSSLVSSLEVQAGDSGGTRFHKGHLSWPHAALRLSRQGTARALDSGRFCRVRR